MPKPAPKPQLAVEIIGATVTLTMTCASHYEAIELYETVCASAREGLVELEIATRPRDAPSNPEG